MTEIKVVFSAANDAWIIIGGNLPSGTCWSQHETQEGAEQEALAIADDIGVEFLN